VQTTKHGRDSPSNYSLVITHPSGARYAVPKPPSFRLKDLPVYSKTLNCKDDLSKMKRFQLTVLGGKYSKLGGKSLSPKKRVEPEEPPESGRSSGQQKLIDWSTTPVYKQFVLKLTEMESLKESGLGLRKRYNEFDLGDPRVREKLLEKALSNTYGETELEYVISILKEQL
jgi:hypothetical protein